MQYKKRSHLLFCYADHIYADHMLIIDVPPSSLLSSPFLCHSNHFKCISKGSNITAKLYDVINISIGIFCLTSVELQSNKCLHFKAHFRRNIWQCCLLAKCNTQRATQKVQQSATQKLQHTKWNTQSELHRVQHSATHKVQASAEGRDWLSRDTDDCDPSLVVTLQ